MRFQLSLTSIVVPKGEGKVVIAFIARSRRPPDPAKTGAGPDPGKRKAGRGKRKAGRKRKAGEAESGTVAESGTKRKAGREAESGTGPILLNWAVPPTSERSSTGRGILISAHSSRATRGTIGRL